MTEVLTLARLTLLRLSRGKTPWVAAAIAAMPIGLALAIGSHDDAGSLFGAVLLVLVILPAMLVAGSIGEEIEERTTTYLWSRPLARWVVLAGKLVALAPIAAVLVVAGWIAAHAIGLGGAPSAGSIAAAVAAALALSCAAAGIATLAPKHGVAVTIVYALVDLTLGQIPLAISSLSITHQARILAGFVEGSASSATIALASTAATWLAIGFGRMRTLES